MEPLSIKTRNSGVQASINGYGINIKKDSLENNEQDPLRRITFKLIEFLINTLDKLQMQINVSDPGRNRKFNSHFRGRGSYRHYSKPKIGVNGINGATSATGANGANGANGASGVNGGSIRQDDLEMNGSNKNNTSDNVEDSRITIVCGWDKLEQLRQNIVDKCNNTDKLLSYLTKLLHGLLTNANRNNNYKHLSNLFSNYNDDDITGHQQKNDTQIEVAKLILSLFDDNDDDDTDNDAGETKGGNGNENLKIQTEEKDNFEKKRDYGKYYRYRKCWILYTVCCSFSTLFLPLLMHDFIITKANDTTMFVRNNFVCLTLASLFDKFESFTVQYLGTMLNESLIELEKIYFAIHEQKNDNNNSNNSNDNERQKNLSQAKIIFEKFNILFNILQMNGNIGLWNQVTNKISQILFSVVDNNSDYFDSFLFENNSNVSATNKKLLVIYDVWQFVKQNCDDKLSQNIKINENNDDDKLMNQNWSQLIKCFFAGDSFCALKGFEWIATINSSNLRNDLHNNVIMFCDNFASKVFELGLMNDVNLLQCVERHRFGVDLNNVVCDVEGIDENHKKLESFEILLLKNGFESIKDNLNFLSCLYVEHS